MPGTASRDHLDSEGDLSRFEKFDEALSSQCHRLRIVECRRLVAVLSNGDVDSLARLALANDITWHVVLSTGAAVKPDQAAYRYAIDELQIDPAMTIFAAAQPWDLRAAAEHGFRTAYVGREGAERPSEADRFDLEVDDLSELAALLAPEGRSGR